jgi:hypothetical protein
MLRYKRQLSQSAFNYLLNDGSFIIPEIKSARPTTVLFTLDIQLRENDILMVYMGTTRILKIKIDTKRSRLIFTADKAYSDKFLGIYNFSNAPQGLIYSYLIKTINTVSPNYFSNEAEGFYQNLICYHHGEKATAASPFIIFDRECVMGYDNTAEKVLNFNPIAEKYQEIIAKEQEKDPKKFGKPKGKKLGNELDLLAIDNECNLCCIELKRGGSASGIYWGPFQVAVYKDIFNKTSLAHIYPDIVELVSQKVKLGLLPVLSDFHLQGHTNFNNVKPFLAIGAPNFDSTCWKSLKELYHKHKPLLDCDIITFDKSCQIKPYIL